MTNSQSPKPAGVDPRSYRVRGLSSNWFSARSPRTHRALGAGDFPARGFISHVSIRTRRPRSAFCTLSFPLPGHAPGPWSISGSRALRRESLRRPCTGQRGAGTCPHTYMHARLRAPTETSHAFDGANGTQENSGPEKVCWCTPRQVHIAGGAWYFDCSLGRTVSLLSPLEELVDLGNIHSGLISFHGSGQLTTWSVHF